MNNDASSEVLHSFISEIATAAAPDHVTDRGIYDEVPKGGKPQKRGEFHAFDKRANHEGRGDDEERHLKGKVKQLRMVPSVVELSTPLSMARSREPTKDLRFTVPSTMPVVEKASE